MATVASADTNGASGGEDDARRRPVPPALVAAAALARRAARSSTTSLDAARLRRARQHPRPYVAIKTCMLSMVNCLPSNPTSLWRTASSEHSRPALRRSVARTSPKVDVRGTRYNASGSGWSFEQRGRSMNSRRSFAAASLQGSRPITDRSTAGGVERSRDRERLAMHDDAPDGATDRTCSQRITSWRVWRLFRPPRRREW